MKSFVVTCIVVVMSNVMIFADANLDKNNEVTKSCLKEVGYSDEEIEKMDNMTPEELSNPDNANKTGCLMACMLTKDGAMTESGNKIDADVICEKVKNDEKVTNKDMVCEEAKKCADNMPAEDDKCKAAQAYIGCLMQAMQKQAAE